MIPGEKQSTVHLCPKASLPGCHEPAAAQASILLAWRLRVHSLRQGPITAAYLPSTSSTSAGGQVGNQASGLTGGCTWPLILSSSSYAIGVQPPHPEQCSIYHARCLPRPVLINTGSAHMELSGLPPHTLMAYAIILAAQV